MSIGLKGMYECVRDWIHGIKEVHGVNVRSKLGFWMVVVFWD